MSVTDWPDVLTAVQAQVTDYWPHPGVPVWWENETQALPDAPATRLHLHLEPGSERLAAFGGGPAGNLWLNEGAVVVAVLVPRGEGVDGALQYLDAMLGIFRDQSRDGVQFGAAVALGLGSAADDGNYWQVIGRAALRWYREG